MKILKIVLPIVVVIVFIGSAITLGRLHSNSPASANSSQQIQIDSDDASFYSSDSNGSPVTSWVPRDDGSYPSTGVAISEDSPTGCRKAIMRGGLLNGTTFCKERQLPIDRIQNLVV